MLSVLITHYNRPEALSSCIKAIRKLNFNLPIEIVVSDDCSDKEILKHIQSLPIDNLITSKTNQGLASNLNRGIKACKGKYLMYVQEDFIISPEITKVLPEAIDLIDNNMLDMVRFRANYRFNHLKPLGRYIAKIPKFSFKNFNVNVFQYSDNPFLTKPKFFENLDYFLDGSSGPYGETEFAIRVVNKGLRIGITDKNYFNAHEGSQSVIGYKPIKMRKGNKRKIWRFARAVRLHIEWLLYNPKKRRLFTYKNDRFNN